LSSAAKAGAAATIKAASAIIAASNTIFLIYSSLFSRVCPGLGPYRTSAAGRILVQKL
jgi:hypothetical protein